MIRKHLINPLIDPMKPKRHRGALPVVTACPFCGTSLKQSDHAKHRPACEEAHRNAPPQPADFMHDAGGGYRADLSFPQT
jgi:hypothetical protein